MRWSFSASPAISRYKMIFPALYALAKSGALDGSRRRRRGAGLDEAQLRERIEDSLTRAGGVDDPAALRPAAGADSATSAATTRIPRHSRRSRRRSAALSGRRIIWRSRRRCSRP